MENRYFKLEIFIPETHFTELRKALHSVDAGHIGNYDCCLSYSRVIGAWRPLAGTDPFIGEEGIISENRIMIHIIRGCGHKTSAAFVLLEKEGRQRFWRQLSARLSDQSQRYGLMDLKSGMKHAW